MKWDLHASHVDCKRELWDHIDRRLMFALSRFATRIGKIDVFLTDDNGPKGGLDKSVLIAIQVRGLGKLVAQVVDSDWVITIDRATARMAHQIRRELERLRQTSRTRREDRSGHEPTDGVTLVYADGSTA